MFKLLITGNGFDIASWLPTKYENFLAFMEELKAKKSQEIENYTNEYERIMDYEQDHVITYENICEKAEEIEKKLKSEPLIQAYSVFLKYYETFNKNKTICLHSDEALNCKEIIRKLEKNEFIARLWSEFRIFVTCLETYVFFVNQVPIEFLKDIAEMDKFKKVTWQLNFNYTDTFRHMLKEKRKKCL